MKISELDSIETSLDADLVLVVQSGVSYNTTKGQFLHSYDNTVSTSYPTTAFGIQNTANAPLSTAIGYGNTSISLGSTALGADNTASGYSSTAIGSDNTATENESLAIGENCHSTGNNAIAIGHNVTSSNTTSIGLGFELTSSGYSSIAIGYSNTSSSLYSIAIGSYNNSAYSSGIAIGTSCNVEAEWAIAIGVNSNAGGTNSIVIGVDASAPSPNSTAIGYNSVARVEYTTNICGPIIISQGDGGNVFPQYGGVENVLMTDVIDFTATAQTTISVSEGALFFVDEVGIIITSADTISGQPSVSFDFEETTGGFIATVATTGLTVNGQRQVFTPVLDPNGHYSLSVTVQTGATATTMQGRAYFKGILVETQS